MAQPLSNMPGGQESNTLSDTAHTLTEEAAQSSARALIGWFSEPEAMQALLGRIAGPLDNVVEVQETWAKYKQAVAARPAFRTANPIIEIEDQQLVAQIQARPDIQATMGNLQWRPVMVNLKKVLSFQRSINLEGLESRIAAARNNQTELLKLCLPEELPLPPSAVNVDPDQKGFTLTSLNPNLRLAGFNVGQAQVNQAPGLPPLPMLQVSLLITLNRSYLQVVHYQNRYFIRDGYHRAAGLLHAGITTVPCLLIEARNLNEVGLLPGLFTPDVIFSDRPPYLADFWNDSVACEITQPAFRKVIRIQSSEFVVPR